MTTRWRLLALAALAVFAVFASTITTRTPTTSQASTAQPSTSPSTTPAPVDLSKLIPRMAIAYDTGGRKAGSNELAWEGAKRSADVFEAELKEITAEPDDTDADLEARLAELAEARYHPIFVVGSRYAAALTKVAPKYPNTWFGFVDDGSVDASNVIGILFNEEQGSFLVGAAAALTSKTGNVGFIGGTRTPRLQKYEAGFTAGAQAADPDVKVQVDYLSESPDGPGDNDTAGAKKAALDMYDAGADVIFAAAGDSGDGVIQAAHDRGLWAIGVDRDRYLTADPSVRGAILTSMLKNVDAATYMIGMEVATGVPKDGNNVFGVGLGGVGYATSGGFVDSITPQLDAFAARIASGEILVPRKPKPIAPPAP